MEDYTKNLYEKYISLNAEYESLKEQLIRSSVSAVNECPMGKPSENNADELHTYYYQLEIPSDQFAAAKMCLGKLPEAKHSLGVEAKQIVLVIQEISTMFSMMGLGSIKDMFNHLKDDSNYVITTIHPTVDELLWLILCRMKRHSNTDYFFTNADYDYHGASILAEVMNVVYGNAKPIRALSLYQELAQYPKMKSATIQEFNKTVNRLQDLLTR
jgi:hypothetical protein